MSETTIYHNPKCSKSRATLALLQELLEPEGQQPKIVLYLQEPPDLATLKRLHTQLKVPVASMMRVKDPDYVSQNLATADTERCLLAIAANSALLERPIVVHGNRAAIGRPPESVLTLFDAAHE
ncbi:MAG: arsenate reductase (glutaredoxin) [Pseudomonadales bacterium]